MQSHEGVSTTGTATGEGAGRKSSKPIMEKRRRARINASLAELKSLLLEAIRKEGARHNKMEKADILEMAVKHLKQIQRQQFSGEPGSSDSSVSSRYQMGYQACAQEVSKYLDSNSAEEIELKTKLLNHLANCITGDTYPPQLSTSPRSELLRNASNRPGLDMFNPSNSSTILGKACPLTSSSSLSLSLSALPSSLLPSTSTSVSVGQLQSSTLPRHLSSSSSSFVSSTETNRVGPPPVLIPIPISPLSLGNISPASIASGNLSPEKQTTQTLQTSSQAVGNSHLNHITVANSLDLSAVRISDPGCYKTISLSQTPNALNTPIDGGKLYSGQGGLPLLSTANLSIASVNPNSGLEMKNGIGMSVNANDNAKITEKTASVLRVSSVDKPITSCVDQNSVLEPNNNTMISAENSNSSNNNSNQITFPSIVNNIERPQKTFYLDQPQIIQILKQQQQQHQPSTVPSQGLPLQKDLQHTQMILSMSNETLNTNSGLIANMNQLQLIPTKTATGEIAFVLSTAIINPAPLAIRPGSQANFAVPLHIPSSASLDQLSATQPLTASQVEKPSTPIQTNQQTQGGKELLKLQVQENGAASSQTKVQSSQNLSTSSHTQNPSVFLSPQSENEQMAPLNLSSPNQKDSSRSQSLDNETKESFPACQLSTPMSAQNDINSVSSTHSSTSLPATHYPIGTSTSVSDTPVSNSSLFHRHTGHQQEQYVHLGTERTAQSSSPRYHQEKHAHFRTEHSTQSFSPRHHQEKHAHFRTEQGSQSSSPEYHLEKNAQFRAEHIAQSFSSGYYQEKDVHFRTEQSAQSSTSRFTEPPAPSHGPRRALGFETSTPAGSFHLQPFASFKPRDTDENANFSVFGRREMTVAYDHRDQKSARLSHSPPAAHTTEWRRRSCSDAGHPLRHDRGRALFRPW